MEKMYGLDLFSGIGGITTALAEWVTPVAYCERDRYAVGVLLSRMHDGRIPVAPIWDDIRSLHGAMLPQVDIIYGGFPCQDISVAGNGVGLAGERSGLFFEIVRLAQEIKPAFIFLENVPAIRTRGLDRVIQELTQVGYDCRWTMLSAADVGANHKRQRWFLLAHTERSWRWEPPSSSEQTRKPFCSSVGEESAPIVGSGCEDVAHAPSKQSRRICVARVQPNLANSSWWKVEPDVGRVADGVPNRVDRLKCLGNAVVPEQAKTAFKILMGIKETSNEVCYRGL